MPPNKVNLSELLIIHLPSGWFFKSPKQAFNFFNCCAQGIPFLWSCRHQSKVADTSGSSLYACVQSVMCMSVLGQAFWASISIESASTVTDDSQSHSLSVLLPAPIVRLSKMAFISSFDIVHFGFLSELCPHLVHHRPQLLLGLLLAEVLP